MPPDGVTCRWVVELPQPLHIHNTHHDGVTVIVTFVGKEIVL